jgi:hypothetical protein
MSNRVCARKSNKHYAILLLLLIVSVEHDHTDRQTRAHTRETEQNKVLK